MDHELDAETTVFHWVIFAGAALTDPEVEPIELILTADICAGLHTGQDDYWAALIALIEDDLAQEQA